MGRMSRSDRTAVDAMASPVATAAAMFLAAIVIAISPVAVGGTAYGAEEAEDAAKAGAWDKARRTGEAGQPGTGGAIEAGKAEGGKTGEATGAGKVGRSGKGRTSESAAMPEAAGEISGTIKPPDKVRRVLALDRDVRQKPIATHVEIREFPASFDPKTGTYSVANLPPGAYDLYIETSDGWRIEGVDLHPAAEAPGPLDREDADAVRAHALGMKTFEDEKRCLRIAGNSENAVLLMELIRRGRTSLRDREPFVIWRMELWFYEKRYGAWTRKEPSKVLRRFRPAAAEFEKWVWLWDPVLGGIKAGRGETARRDYEIPATLRPEMGRYPSVGGRPERDRETDRKPGIGGDREPEREPGRERESGPKRETRQTGREDRPGGDWVEEETVVPDKASGNAP
ncbi:MAG: hypothetical protein N3A38_00800 [Planctomycetota bacterium]|nr:hypothetical protein [Planctomycetota bacterium]